MTRDVLTTNTKTLNRAKMIALSRLLYSLDEYARGSGPHSVWAHVLLEDYKDNVRDEVRRAETAR